MALERVMNILPFAGIFKTPLFRHRKSALENFIITTLRKRYVKYILLTLGYFGTTVE